MIILENIKNQKINIVKLVQILFFTFPLSFILGNLIINLHLLLFIAVSLFLVKKGQLKLRFQNFYWLLIFFFLYLFLSTTFQFHDFFNEWRLLKNMKIESIPLKDSSIFKSFLLMRFLILIFIIDTLFINKILNIKKIFLISLICASFVSFDIIIQYVVGFDLFGFKSIGTTNSGPFGDEFIAGSYLQKLSLFSFFYSFLIFENRKYKNIFIIFIILLHSTAILLAGNKMPLILFLFGCVLAIFFSKNLRYLICTGLAIFLLTFVIIFKNDENIRDLYSAFYDQINFAKIIKLKKLYTKRFVEEKSKLKLDKDEKTIHVENYPGITTPPVRRMGDACRTARVDDYSCHVEKALSFLRGSGHRGIYRTSLMLWKEQPWLGNGLKSFRFKCWIIMTRLDDKTLHCSNHPHNYYLELLSEAGVFGTTFIMIFFIIILKDSFVYLKRNYRKVDSDLNLFIPILLTFFVEIWPIKSTGSFFTTWNATFIWLIISLLCAMLYSKKT